MDKKPAVNREEESEKENQRVKAEYSGTLTPRS
jgi:hypothetical protein